MPKPLTATERIWDRKKWQEEKEANGKVPKGASKVSMGDAIEKFHKASAKNLKDGRKACEDLKKAITTYKAAIKTKYPKLLARIERQLEYFVDQYLSDSEKVFETVPHYSKLREDASTQLLIAGAEFQHWEKGGSKGAFKPSNDKKLVDALTKFVECCGKMVFYTDKVTEAARKKFDQTVYAASAGTWNKPTVEGLVAQVKELPNSI